MLFAPCEAFAALFDGVGFANKLLASEGDEVLNKEGLTDELAAAGAGLEESLNRFGLPKALAALGALFELSNRLGALEVAVVAGVFEVSPNKVVLEATLAGAVVVAAWGVCPNRLGVAVADCAAVDKEAVGACALFSVDASGADVVCVVALGANKLPPVAPPNAGVAENRLGVDAV